jgi:antitoxin component HigA of HigAB toxin-antitoxin module
MPPDDSTPAEILHFLLEHSGKAAADLEPVFGERGHVDQVLRGNRAITADQARKLGNLFSMSPGLFVR